jgi:tRNA-Thr(GGU) m(6)t(6)A37 methyltransferase TsaA
VKKYKINKRGNLTATTITIKPIGIIHTPFTSKDECPIQPVYAADAAGSVEVFAEFARGLKDIEGFSHIYLLYHFDRAGKIELVRPTFLADEPHGVFASRHPCRPNGIGISIVRLKQRNGNVLMVEGIDVLDNTALLDIKPYVARFDRIETSSEGWIAKTQWRPKPEGRE